jgi:glycosyltransferase involved in cell wall biosynthesis
MRHFLNHLYQTLGKEDFSLGLTGLLVMAILFFFVFIFKNCNQGYGTLVLISAFLLASGRPVVATANPDTQVARVLEGCGVVVPPADAEAFANAVVGLVNRPDDRARLGQAARSFAVERWSKDDVLRLFEKAVIEGTKPHGPESTEKLNKDV